MSAWVDGVLLSAVDSALLTDSVIASLAACLFDRTSLLVTSFYSLQRSP